MKNIFKPEDFAKINGIDIHIQHCDYVNRKLNELIEAAPVLFVHKDEEGFYGGEGGLDTATHKARLMFIEELVKEPCKHEPIQITKDMFLQNVIIPSFLNLPTVACTHCGIELKAKWEAK